MSRTGSRLIELSLGSLGRREDGYIGSLTASEAARESLNNALLEAIKDVNLAEFEEVVTVDVASSAYSYDIPTTASGNTIRVKNVVAARLLRDGETVDYPMKRVSRWRSIKDMATPRTSHKGRPVIYRVFAEKVEFYPYPDTDYTFTMWVDRWPTVYTANNIASEHELGVEWDSYLEWYTTGDLFHKLQQPEEGANWLARAERAKVQNIQALRQDSDLEIHGSTRERVNPYVPVDLTSKPSETYFDIESGQHIGV